MSMEQFARDGLLLCAGCLCYCAAIVLCVFTLVAVVSGIRSLFKSSKK